jgi:hypothetical protein
LPPGIPEPVLDGFENENGTYVKEKKFSTAYVADGVGLVTAP